MPKSTKKRFSTDVIAHWPEVFKDIQVKSVPLEYLQSINITFQDGKVWVIDIDEKAKINPDMEYGLDSLFKDYDHVITNIDFRLNTKKVRADIEKRTKQFLKKRK